LSSVQNDFRAYDPVDRKNPKPDMLRRDADANNAVALSGGFADSPLVVPLFFAIHEAIWGGGIGSAGQVVGIFVTYGAYASIFALLLGGAILWALMRASKTDAITMAIAGAGVASLAAGLFFAIGLRSVSAIVMAIAAGALVGLVFRSIAGLRPSGAL
jgi:hypothetical protein